MLYRAFSSDLLFYYAIDILFLTQAKGLPIASVIFADTLYTLFKIILQIPCGLLIDKIGNKKALVLANASLATYVLIVLFASDIKIYILANMFSSFGFAIKVVSGTDILYELLPDVKDKGPLFSKVDGKGVGYYFYAYAVSSIISGVLYAVNPYLPMIASLFVALYGVYITTKFINKESNAKKEKVTVKKQLDDIKYAYKYIFKSKRLSSLLMLYSFVSGFVIAMGVYQKKLLQDLNVPSSYFGVIFAIFGIISAVVSNNLNLFHKRYKNKTLANLSTSYMLLWIIAGIVVSFNIPNDVKITTIIIVFIIQAAIKEPFISLSKRYLGNFANQKLRTKIYAVSELTYSAMRSLVGFFGAFCITILPTGYVVTVFSVTSVLIVLLILKYMSDKVGLKPEQYNKSDIEFEVEDISKK